MLFISITKNGTAHHLTTGKVEEFSLHSCKVTVAVDNFLSDFFVDPDGFSLVESPLISTVEYKNVVFLKVSYDKKNDRLTIYRSTVAGRPVYYHINPAGEFFCSTHVSLLRAAGVPIQENTEVLPEFFVYRFVMPPHTLYKNIFQLNAGDNLQIKFEHDKATPLDLQHYMPPQPTDQHTLSDVIEHTYSLLNNAVQTLDPVHKNISLLLSGGLDSSILYKICQQNFRTETTFSTGFPFENPKNNIEKDYSLSAARLFKTHHYYLDMTSEEYLHDLLEAIAKAEVPVHHLQSVPIYALFKKIPKQTNIVISGLGADDLFGTITQYNQYHVEQSLLYKLVMKYVKSSYIKHLLTLLKRDWRNYAIIQENYRKSTYRLTDINHLVWSIGAHGSEEWTMQYFNIQKEEIIKHRYNEIKKLIDRSIYDILSIWLFLGSASMTQTIWSKLGECEQKILYYPYTHQDLIHYAFSIPWALKVKTPKNILRFVAKKVDIPDEIINRQKSGFGITPELWAQKNGIFESLVPLAAKIINEEEIRKVQSTNLKKAMIYWNMLNYSIWKRLCIHNEPLDVLLEEIA